VVCVEGPRIEVTTPPRRRERTTIDLSVDREWKEKGVVERSSTPSLGDLLGVEAPTMPGRNT